MCTKERAKKKRELHEKAEKAKKANTPKKRFVILLSLAKKLEE